MNDEIKHFRTTDMPLISFLRYNNCTVEKIERINDYKAEFIFNSVDRSLLDMFNADQGLVEPKMYSSIMRQQTQSARRVTKQ